MKIRNLFLLLITFSFAVTTAGAQELSWRKHRTLAESLEKEGDKYSAADNYRMAWEKKQSKVENIYKAAELYYQLNAYRAAADAYQHVPAVYETDKLVLLKYARMLKQDGQYDKARTVFQQLRDSYTGTDKAILEDIIRVELRGVDMTRDMAAATDRRLEVTHTGIGINTKDEEFGPIAISDDILYFTSTTGGQARIYESQRQGRTWGKAANPNGFPVVQGGQYANGAMTADGQRFYFTICNNDSGWNGTNTRCEIYVTNRSANGWTAPERLPDFINVKGVNTSYPAVLQRDGQEFLFFASNREGGRGGLDIWYVTRDAGIDGMDFSFPVNLGPVINTLGDEITPFFDKEDDMLYFASNGHPSMGGYDIFKAKGNETTWTPPVNAGLPLNSAANDYGYVRSASGFGGFFASNRVFGGEKTTTLNEDIFEFAIGGRQITLKANVYAEDNGNLLENIDVSLYQLFDDGNENLLITKNFPTGSYLFELLPNRRFRVEVKRSGYEQGGYVFATDSPSASTYGQPLFLVSTNKNTPTATNPATANPGTGIMTENPTTTTPTTPAGTGTKPTSTPSSTPTSTGVPVGDSSAEYTARGTSEKDNVRYTSSAPRYDGTYFRIQVAALKRYDPAHAKFTGLTDFGVPSTETLPDKGITRVLVGDYFNEAEATQVLSAIRSTHPEAYIVKYDNGVRYGRVNF